ncbi:MAG: hypothetical protein H0W88_07740 [Parachlamydiaceae bacterium]|nr:hypothetical protein [Parachlamydiaceae bacterium]
MTTGSNPIGPLGPKIGGDQQKPQIKQEKTHSGHTYSQGSTSSDTSKASSVWEESGKTDKDTVGKIIIKATPQSVSKKEGIINSIKQARSYWGDVGRHSTEITFAGGMIGRCLLRDSSEKGSYAFSYVNKQREIKHILLTPADEGLKVLTVKDDGEEIIKTFSSLKEFTDSVAESLKPNHLTTYNRDI